MWGSLEILESYVGERNKIRFDGNIKRKLGLDCQYVRFGEKGRKLEKREETKESCDFCNFKVRVSLAFNIINL